VNDWFQTFAFECNLYPYTVAFAADVMCSRLAAFAATSEAAAAGISPLTRYPQDYRGEELQPRGDDDGSWPTLGGGGDAAAAAAAPAAAAAAAAAAQAAAAGPTFPDHLFSDDIPGSSAVGLCTLNQVDP
jgi:hypothetical protein